MVEEKKYIIRWTTEEDMRALYVLGKGFEHNKKDCSLSWVFEKGLHENACQLENGHYTGKYIREYLDKGYILIDAKDYLKLKLNKDMPMKDEDFNIGDKITILGKPEMWSSFGDKDCPLISNIKYPYTCIIQGIRRKTEYPFTAMHCNTYGWDLTNLIKLGLIRKESQEESFSLISEIWK